ncbi:MAG: EamA family transporter [Alkalispirochaeta sp.]
MSNSEDAGRREAWGPYLVLAAAVLWGTSGTAQALAPAGSTPLMIGGVRVGVGGLVLLASAAFRRELLPMRGFLRPVILLAGIMQVVFNVSYFTALSLTGVAVGTMVAIGSAPIFAGVLGIVFDRDPVKPVWYGATLMAITGLVVLSVAGGELSVNLLGIAAALAAGLSYSMYTFLTRRLIARYTPDAVMGVSFIAATAVLMPFLATGPVAWMRGPGGLGTVLYLGIISSGAAYMLYGRGLRVVPVSDVGTLTLAEPLTAAFLGIVLLREPVSLSSVAGMVMIFMAQVVVVSSKRKSKRPPR